MIPFRHGRCRVQFVVGMSLVELNSAPELLAIFLRHFSRIVNRGKTVLIYSLKDLTRIALRCLETESREGILEGKHCFSVMLDGGGPRHVNGCCRLRYFPAILNVVLRRHPVYADIVQGFRPRMHQLLA